MDWFIGVLMNSDKSLKCNKLYKNLSEVSLKFFVFIIFFIYLCNMKENNVKPYGYWNDKNHCLEEAKKYKNKFELQRKCNGCYRSAIRNGWLDDVASLYDNSIQYMRYDEPVNCIYVYEYKDLNHFYVGRTNNIKRRNKQHCNGYLHRDGSRTYDIVYKFAKNNNISIPKPIILEDKLTAEQSQDREDYWKKFYIDNGMKCLNKGATGIGKGSLGATVRWTYDEFYKEALKYSYKTEMKYKNQSAYKAGVHNGWINIPFENRKKKDKYWDNIDNVLDAAKNSMGAKDMIKKYGGAYNSARKHGWLNLLEYNKKP